MMDSCLVNMSSKSGIGGSVLSLIEILCPPALGCLTTGRAGLFRVPTTCLDSSPCLNNVDPRL